MSTFQDAIAYAVVRGFYAMSGGDPTELADEDISPNSGDLQLAWQVLAMPEMEAIRKALRDWAEYAGTFDSMGAEYALRELLGSPLPDNVIAWVLGGAQ